MGIYIREQFGLLLGVVLPFLNVKAPKDFVLLAAVVHFPGDEVHLFKQLLLMKFEFTNHFYLYYFAN